MVEGGVRAERQEWEGGKALPSVTAHGTISNSRRETETERQRYKERDRDRETDRQRETERQRQRVYGLRSNSATEAKHRQP